MTPVSGPYNEIRITSVQPDYEFDASGEDSNEDISGNVRPDEGRRGWKEDWAEGDCFYATAAFQCWEESV